MNIAYAAHQSRLSFGAVYILADFTPRLGGGGNEPVAGSKWGTPNFFNIRTPFNDELMDER